MILEIEGLQVKIIYTADEKVSIVSVNNELLTLRIPALLPQNELKEIVKLYKKNKHQEDGASYVSKSIHIFDKEIPIRIIKSIAKEAYLDREIIHLPHHLYQKLSNTNYVETVKLTLLKSMIMKTTGRWEEILGILVNNINFRKIKTKYYITCLKSNSITWNTSVMNQTIEMINYLVLDALLSVSNVSKEKCDEIKDRHIPNWVFFQKNIDYETRNANVFD